MPERCAPPPGNLVGWLGILPACPWDLLLGAAAIRRVAVASGENFYHYDRVGGNFGLEAPRERAQIFVLPKIAHLGGDVVGIADLVPVHADVGVRLAAVQQNHCAAPVAQWLYPHFPIAFLADAVPFTAQLILQFLWFSHHSGAVGVSA